MQLRSFKLASACLLLTSMTAIGCVDAFHLNSVWIPTVSNPLVCASSFSRFSSHRPSGTACLHMQQSNFNDFDDEPQYSMDSLSFSNTAETSSAPAMEMQIPSPERRDDDDNNVLTKLKLRVFLACSGLDRGSVADNEERTEVDQAVGQLEKQAPLSASDFPEAFDGKWRLVYTSALSPGSASGGGAGASSLPIFQTPAPAARASFGGRGQVGQVFQDVQVKNGRLDNVVVVNPPGPLPLGKTTLRLEHKLEFVPGNPKRCKITLVNVEVDGPLKQLGLQPLRLPVLEAISSQGAGVFDTTFCDDDMRIARGDRGELRIFVRC